MGSPSSVATSLSCEYVLFVPYASDDHDVYTLQNAGFCDVRKGRSPEWGCTRSRASLSAVRDADGIYVGGGKSSFLPHQGPPRKRQL